MKFRLCLLAVASMTVLQVQAQEAKETPQQRELLQLVQRYTQAQHDFAPEKIDALVTSGFFEVSPLGEIDPREKVLGFYLPAKKTDAPVMALSEPKAQVFGDTGTILVKLSGSMSVNGQQRDFAFRGGYVAVKEGGQWKLVSAQYTGIRPPKAP